jgi:hypothetical protein
MKEHDVIIPAREETLHTLVPTIDAFLGCTLIQQVFVVDDGLDTFVRHYLLENYGHLISMQPGPREGKGQAVETALPLVECERVILCDGDLHGFKVEHAWMLAGAFVDNLMIMGITEYEDYVYLPRKVNPDAWIQVTGERSLPVGTLRRIGGLHGYAMEVQINAQADKDGLAKLPIDLPGVHGTSRWTPRRIEEMKRDGIWLRENFK